MKNRRIRTALALLPALLAGHVLAEDPAPLQMSFVYGGPANNPVGWVHGHEVARQTLQREIPTLKTGYVEKVSGNSDAQGVLRQLARQGSRVIVGASFSFMNPVMQAAKQNPGVVYLCASCYKQAPNVGNYLAATYQGVGERAVEVAAEHVATRRSVKNQTTYSNDPDIRWRIAEAALIMNAVGPQIRELARDIDEGVDRGRSWMPQLSAAKNAAAEATLRAVEQAMRACGGSAYYNTHELSRLYRDALAGLFQPSDQESLHAAWANLILGPIEKAQ